jgi:hypothetical protein
MADGPASRARYGEALWRARQRHMPPRDGEARGKRAAEFGSARRLWWAEADRGLLASCADCGLVPPATATGASFPAAVRALRCPRPGVMAPTSAGPPVRDPKMTRERLGYARPAIHARSPRGARTAPVGCCWTDRLHSHHSLWVAL